MKIYLYDRKEAIKNNCYKSVIEYEILKDIIKLILKCLLIFALPFLIAILSVTYEFYFLSDFALYIIVLICFIISVFIMPINYVKERKKCVIWFYRALIKDENDKIWLVEQEYKHTSYLNEKDEFYRIFKNEKLGIVTELKDLKMIKESRKFYTCVYKDNDNSDKIIEIAKAYKDLKEVL